MKSSIKIVSDLYSDELVLGAKLIQHGKLVVFPTETVYGIGANALDESAVHKIFYAKNRPATNPLIMHFADPEHIYDYVEFVPELAREIISKLMPGPITLVLPKHKSVPSIVTAGQNSVCVRVPAHPIARALIALAGVPVVAPSANKSTRPSATRAFHASDDFGDKVDLILKDPMEEHNVLGIESTIIDCTQSQPVILRQGAYSQENLMDLFPDLNTSPSVVSPVTPGSSLLHYSPRVPVVVWERDILDSSCEYHNQVMEQIMKQTSYKVLSSQSVPGIDQNKQIIFDDAQVFASNLFAVFRQAEVDNLSYLFVVLLVERGIGRGVNDRIRRASQRYR